VLAEIDVSVHGVAACAATLLALAARLAEEADSDLGVDEAASRTSKRSTDRAGLNEHGDRG
jgi:hypothetical protein